jgi:restriction system protein
MLPFLERLSDGNPHDIWQLNDDISGALGLTEHELAELLPSGKQRVIINRIGWARTYLFKAGLTERVARGSYRITERGRALLKENPPKIDVTLLRRYPEFLAWQSKSSEGVSEESMQLETPEEVIQSRVEQLNRELRATLLGRVINMVPSQFEQLLVDLMLKMGYGGSRKDAGTALGRSGDGGVDGVINEDVLGLDRIYLQAKRWSNTVGRPEVQAFAGSLEGHRARKGVMLTTSSFSHEAHQYVDRIEKRIVLIDGDRLAQLMIDYRLGVAEESTHTICRIDSDYFEED